MSDSKMLNYMDMFPRKFKIYFSNGWGRTFNHYTYFLLFFLEGGVSKYRYKKYLTQSLVYPFDARNNLLCGYHNNSPFIQLTKQKYINNNFCSITFNNNRNKNSSKSKKVEEEVK